MKTISKFDYRMFLQCVDEASDRANNMSLSADVRERSQETLDLLNQRMEREGFDYPELVRRAA